MDIQRLRNLTTGRLHTEIGDVYKDLESITGMEGLMTHMLPNVMRALLPWLREKVKEPEYWNDEYETFHKGEFELPLMSESEKEDFMMRYRDLKDPLTNKKVIGVVAN